MKPPPTEPEVRHIHDVFCKVTNQDLPFMHSYFYPWEKFLLEFNEHDLRLVVSFIKAKRAKGDPCRSLNFRNFIRGTDSLESFNEDLAEARARARKNPVPKKVMKFAGPDGYVKPEDPIGTARPAGEVLPKEKSPEEMKAFFDKCRRDAGLDTDEP